MTGTNVMNLMQVNQMTNNIAKAISSVEEKSITNVDFAFSTVMISTTSQSGNVIQGSGKNQVEGDTLSTSSSTSAEVDYEKYQYKNNDIKKSDVKTFEEEAQEMAEEINEFREKLVATICEDLDIDMEELEEILGQLGMAFMDLMEPKNLVEFVKALSGVTESAELLTNEQFQNLFTDVSEMVADFVKETGFSVDELQDFAEYLLETPSFENALENVDLNQMQNQVLSDGETSELYEEIEVVVKNELQEDKTVDEKKQDFKIVSDEVEEIPEEKIAKLASDTKDYSLMKQKKDSSSMMHESMSFSPNQTVEVSTSIQSFVDNISSYQSIDTQKIIEQIVEQIKISVSTDVSNIEMQLNPENLGKVYMNISSKEGAINAQIYAQNETVREALEMQVVTLKENLTQAGVKVDAIEVSVGTHEFERNLEQDQRRDEENGQYHEKIAGKRRNIRLDSLDDLVGLMSEEESLVAQMMMDYGNSVDLTA